MSRWNSSGLNAWINSHIIDYPTAYNVNFSWSFGSAAGFCLSIQVISGIFLSMSYVSDINLAFISIEYIMRDLPNGWLIRYMHANGASFFFIAAYLHVFRGLYYGSYKKPRQVLWWSGAIIFILMMATAFMGYVLPWGQMSFWALTVITNLLTVIPRCGRNIMYWVWGGWAIGKPTLRRFYSLHFILPFVIIGLVFIHLSLLHKDGSNNPLGFYIKSANIKFYPYLYVKDLFGFFILLLILSFFIFYHPNSLGDPLNYVEANYIKTPKHIVPEWYFLPYYAILRAIPHKTGGIVAMGAGIASLFIYPLLDVSLIRSGNYRPIYSKAFWFFFSTLVLLAVAGTFPTQDPRYIRIINDLPFEIAKRCLKIIFIFYCLSYLFLLISSQLENMLLKNLNKFKANYLEGRLFKF